MLKAEDGALTDAFADAQLKLSALQSVDVTKTTKTQIFTLIMVILIIMYSVPLMWNIVLVNGYFDRHEDLLVNQSRRELKATATNPEALGASDHAKRYEGMLKMTTESARKT